MSMLRHLPGIDRLLQSSEMAPIISAHGIETVKRQLRKLQSSWREQGDMPSWAVEPKHYAAHLQSMFATAGYQAVFNLTGTIIHTNLGRALLSEEMMRSVEPLVTQPMNLEYDLSRGSRGDRDKIVEDRLKVLTGAEAATVVNNNAAAVMLCLNSIALGADVIVSRGELIEIGGSFRLPELMERAGCRLEEVGTTNRTHLKDYRAAIDDQTAMLLKVHPSNYHISGFTREASIPDLAELAHERQLPLCVDLGSGTLVDLERWGLPHEPTPQEILQQGADLVTFSGDKLLGSVQAGIIVGRERYVALLKSNPMKRALRPDKLTLAFLDKTLRLYEAPESLAENLPLLRCLTTPLAVLEERGNAIADCLKNVLPEFSIELVSSECQIGSGSLPDQNIASRAIRISHDNDAMVRSLGEQLRALETPVIVRLHREALWLDLRGAERLQALLAVLRTIGQTT
jgi:L-seryl-tRNA(Ser) seleniumtransferase